MPAAIDLTGKRFGRLTVARRGDFTPTYGGCWLWVCRCDCGVEILVPQKRLPYADWIVRLGAGRVIEACPECAGGKCVICGAVIPRTRLPAVTCEGECADEHRKARQRKAWRRRIATDPDLAKRMNERRKERMGADPDYAAKVKDWERRRQIRRTERMACDPEYAAQERARANALYARHAERIQAKRKATIAAMPDAELAELTERMREYCRVHRQRERADPARAQRRKEYEAEYRRRMAEAKAQDDLARLAEMLQGRENASKVKPCVVCGKPVVGRHSMAKVCSKECRRLRTLQIHYPPRPRECVVCGKVFESKTCAKLCSPECRLKRKAAAKRKREKHERPDATPE